MSTAFLSDRVLGIEPSPSIAANALVTELRAEGRDIINFTVGEPDFDTPQHILAAASAAMHSGDTHYTATTGTLALRQAICQKLERDNGLAYGMDEVVAGCGDKHIIYHALAATLNLGDEVIVHVNGTLVNHGSKSTATSGRIALQAEGSEVEFRKVELTKLP